jgi:hypothetical protein
MKIRVVSSKEEINTLNPNEEDGAPCIQTIQHRHLVAYNEMPGCKSTSYPSLL